MKPMLFHLRRVDNLSTVNKIVKDGPLIPNVYSVQTYCTNVCKRTVTVAILNPIIIIIGHLYDFVLAVHLVLVP